ncbi:MAG: hypothetical protein L6Q69_09710 [Zoogloea sp.]|nr:hypothetical protein [Zoogloea sp.]
MMGSCSGVREFRGYENSSNFCARFQIYAKNGEITFFVKEMAKAAEPGGALAGEGL